MRNAFRSTEQSRLNFYAAQTNFNEYYILVEIVFTKSLLCYTHSRVAKFASGSRVTGSNNPYLCKHPRPEDKPKKKYPTF